jgi:hypothetical protein
MAEPEVEAAWRAEFKRIHATEAPESWRGLLKPYIFAVILSAEFEQRDRML